jgi:metal-dependent hydrolase (beta-lactamase superfamily II)
MTTDSYPFKFVGTGGVFDYKYGNSSLIIDVPQKILIDIGPLVYPRLAETGAIEGVEYLLLTHLHGDHIGGIFQYIFHNKGKLGKVSKILFQNEIFRNEISALLDAMSIPKTHYEFVPVSELQNIECIDTTGKHAENVTSFGFVFHLNKETIYYSGDLGDIEVSNQVLRRLQPENTIVLHEVHHKGGKAHVNYRELEELSNNFKMFGYHCNPDLIPKDNKIPLASNYPEIIL